MSFTKTIHLEVEIEDWTDREEKKTLAMTMADCSTYLKAGDKSIGDVSACVGGGLRVSLNTEPGSGKIHYQAKISHEKIWNAVMKALEQEQYLLPEADKESS